MSVLSESGYVAASRKLLATRFGLPQRRWRVYVIAVKMDIVGLADTAHATLARALHLLDSISLTAEPSVHAPVPVAIGAQLL